MANYVSRDTGAKKAEALKRAERSLSGAIRRGVPLSKAEKLAEKVREAKLGYLKARLFAAKANPSDVDHSAEISNLEADQLAWKSRSAAEIVSDYGATD